MTQPTPLTEQQLDEITAKVAELRERLDRNNRWPSDNESFFVAEGWKNGTRNALDKLDPAGLVAEIRRLAAALTEMTHCRDSALRALYRDDVETDIDLEEAIAAPFYGPGWDWDEQALAAVVKEAAGAIRPAFGKLTQERDRLRAELSAEAGQAEVTLDRVRRIASRLAAHAVGFGDVLDDSDRGPWAKTVGADIAELTAALSPDTAPPPASAPLDASHGPAGDREGETATRAATGRTGDPRRTLTPNEYDAAWHAVEGAAGEDGADPGTVLHAVLARLGIDTPAAEEVTQ